MIKTPLHKYQEEAIRRAVSALRGGGGFALFAEQRVRKTLMALSVVDRLHPDWLLVVCPKVAIPEWNKQIERHLEVDWDLRVTVINYEAIVNHRKKWYTWLKKAQRSGAKIMMICDESHFIKRRGASRSRVVRKCADYADYRLALTGTPIAQGIQDAWAQFDFINPEIFGIWEEFSERYLIYGGYKKKNIVKYRHEDEFYEKFHLHSFRMTLREAKKESSSGLTVHYQKRYVELEARAARIYDKLKYELIAVVNEKKVKVKNVLSQIAKLQQVTGGAVLDADRIPQVCGSEKLEELHTVTRSLRSGEKFLVIARFIHEIERIAAFLRRLGYSVAIVRGGEPFDGKFSTDAIVMQIQSGIARDMSAADTTIFYSPDYSYLNFEQSKSRILAFDKSHAQFIFLIARNSIDEIIYAALTTKQNLAKLVCDTYRNRPGA